MDNLWHEEDIDVALKVTNDIHKSTFRQLIETMLNSQLGYGAMNKFKSILVSKTLSHRVK